jgi:hypothetical protein
MILTNTLVELLRENKEVGDIMADLQITTKSPKVNDFIDRLKNAVVVHVSNKKFTDLTDTIQISLAIFYTIKQYGEPVITSESSLEEIINTINSAVISPLDKRIIEILRGN